MQSSHINSSSLGDCYIMMIFQLHKDYAITSDVKTAAGECGVDFKRLIHKNTPAFRYYNDIFMNLICKI